jgi:hypothetical protein
MVGNAQVGGKPAEAAAQSGGTYLSAYAAMLQADLDSLGRKVRSKDSVLIQRYSLVRQCCTWYVPAFLTLDHPYQDGELKDLGVRVQSVQGNMVTALISTRKYGKLIASGRVTSIEVTPPVQLRGPEKLRIEKL